MLSTLPSVDTLARQVGFYREHLPEAPAPLYQNLACGKVDIARWVYVAETDAAAKRDTEAGIVRHISHFMSSATSGYLGNVSEKSRVDTLNYDTLAATTLVHGSPDTVIAKLHALRATTGLTSLLLHYPPSYGHEKTMQSLRLFAERVMPEFRPPTRREAVT
jgi:alkanesulfonate monooxygenase SsuD/methylene tetrahydromethanopterin reductase-like flavin-dependent oxidoreductase (luciferase family)